MRYRYAFSIFVCVFVFLCFCTFELSHNLFISVFFSFLFLVLITEAIFRFCFKIGSNDQDAKFTIFIQGHPYLPFIYKPNTLIPMLPKYEYDFMGDDCSFPHIKTNNRGHLNGENGDRAVCLNKKAGTIRVSTLGDSVSANYVTLGGINYNFSVEIERQLFAKNHKVFEVSNCSIGGYTTIDILVKFLIKDIHEKPDFVVLNHGYSNIRSYLSGKYESDNSHYRKSFSKGEVRYKIASYIPFKNSAFYKFFFAPWLPIGSKDYLKFVSVDNLSIDEEWQGFNFFEINLKNLIVLSRFNSIEFILCTCPHYLHSDIIPSKSHQRFHEGMKIQNEIIRKVAKEMNVYIVDNEKIVKPSNKNFIDSIHLSPNGMKISAQGVSEMITSIINKSEANQND